MKKILSIILASTFAASAIADDANSNKYTSFQKFDNHASFGINYENGNLSRRDSANNPANYSVTALNLEVSKLFDLGLWLDVNIANAQTYNQTTSNAPGGPLGDFPSLITLNTKIGYNFPITSYFAVVPYITVGKNSNITNVTSSTGYATNRANITNNYYYTVGGGVRLEYPLNQYVGLYLDQMYARNMDQTKYTIAKTQLSTSNDQWTTSLGLKVRPWSKLILSTDVFYTNYSNYDQNTLNILTMSSPKNPSYGPPTTSIGGRLAIGFTFE